MRKFCDYLLILPYFHTLFARFPAHKITTFPPTFQIFSQKKLSTASPPYTLHLTPATPLLQTNLPPRKKAVIRLKFSLCYYYIGCAEYCSLCYWHNIFEVMDGLMGFGFVDKIVGYLSFIYLFQVLTISFDNFSNCTL